MSRHYPKPRDRPGAWVLAPDVSAGIAASDHDEWLGGENIEIDDLHTPSFESYLDDLSEGLDEATLRVLPDHPGYWVGQDVDANTLLLWEDGEQLEVAGFYMGPTLAVDDIHQGRGLGTILVVEHCLTMGCNPQLYCDDFQYSSAGLAAHRAALEMIDRAAASGPIAEPVAARPDMTVPDPQCRGPRP